MVLYGEMKAWLWKFYPLPFHAKAFKLTPYRPALEMTAYKSCQSDLEIELPL
jgi:hypothetical protein